MELFRRWIGIIIRPAKTFDEIKKERLWRTLLYYLLLLLPPALVLFVGGLIVRARFLAPYLGDRQLGSWLIILLVGPLFLLGGFVGLGLGTLSFQPFVFLFGGRRGLAQTLKVLAYSHTPLLLSLCFPPVLAVGMVWSIALAAVGLRRAQQMRVFWAILAPLSPLVLLLVVILLARLLYLS